jgi:hypothetical protein
MIFATAGGLLDVDTLAPPPSATPHNTAAGWPFPFTSPSPYVHLLYFGAQVRCGAVWCGREGG